MTEQPLLTADAGPAARPVTEPTYRYVFADLLTDRDLAVLPMTGVGFGVGLNAQGPFSGTALAPNRRAADAARRVVEGKTALYVYRTLGALTQIWWGGVVWVWRPARSGRKLTIDCQGAAFDSLADDPTEQDLTYAAVDQLAIVRDVWAKRQALPGGDLGVVVDDTVSGVLRDKTVLLGDQTWRQVYAEEADNENGFEHLLDASLLADGTRQRRLRLGYPRLGSAATTHLMECPGSLLSWTWTGDATRGGTVFRGRGESVQPNQTEEARPLISAPAVAQDLLDAGWPRRHVLVDHSSVKDQATLDGHARAARDELAGSVRIPSVTARLVGTALSPKAVGDSVRLRITDRWFPARDGAAGLDVTQRLTAMNVTPKSRAGQERAELVFEEAL